MKVSLEELKEAKKKAKEKAKNHKKSDQTDDLESKNERKASSGRTFGILNLLQTFCISESIFVRAFQDTKV